MTTPTRENLRHGYTFDQLWTIARNSAAANRFLAHDHHDLITAAFDGIVDHVLSCDEAPPTLRDLYSAGKTGIQDLVRGYRQTYGFKDRDGFAGPGSAPMFAKFWAPVQASPFEDRVVEHIANEQIMSVLADRDRAVLVALAVRDDYAVAAEALGMPPGSYRTYISQARRNYLTHWHGEETPVPQRGYNRRRHGVDRQPCGTHAALRRHRKNREPIDEACRVAGREYERRKACSCDTPRHHCPITPRRSPDCDCQ